MAAIDRILRVAAAGTIAATLLSYAARAWWGFELVTHFKLQLFAAALVLAASLKLRRRRPFAIVLAAVAAMNGAPLARNAGFAASTAASVDTLAVLSVNVRWTSDTYSGLLDIIAKQNPDVVLVVEFTPAWQQGLASLDERYPYRLLAPRHDPYGVALWSRYPIAASALGLESTSAVNARVDTPRGPMRLIGVHLRAPTTRARAVERNRQYQDLARLVGSSHEPLIVAGDFNTTPYSPYFADWLSATGLLDVRSGLDITWPTYLPFLGIPIDHCVVNTKIKAAEFVRLPAFGSDHYPILCRITLDGQS